MAEIKAKIENGMLIIESNSEKGSDRLNTWMIENRPFFDKRMDIEIIAY